MMRFLSLGIEVTSIILGFLAAPRPTLISGDDVLMDAVVLSLIAEGLSAAGFLGLVALLGFWFGYID